MPSGENLLTHDIGAKKLDIGQKKYYKDYFRLLGGQWQYFPKEEYIKEINDYFKKYYDNDCLNIFNDTVNFNRKFVKENPKATLYNFNYEKFSYLLNNKNILIYNINDKYNTSKALYEFTEFMITRYPENTSFEKEKYVNLEKLYLNKLNYANETIKDINNNYVYKNIKNNNFKKMFFNDKNLNYIQEYLEKKNQFSIHLNISQMELEEIKILFNYDGGKLKKKWKWVENISFVYIITY